MIILLKLDVDISKIRSAVNDNEIAAKQDFLCYELIVLRYGPIIRGSSFCACCLITNVRNTRSDTKSTQYGNGLTKRLVDVRLSCVNT